MKVKLGEIYFLTSANLEGFLGDAELKLNETNQESFSFLCKFVT